MKELPPLILYSYNLLICKLLCNITWVCLFVCADLLRVNVTDLARAFKRKKLIYCRPPTSCKSFIFFQRWVQCNYWLGPKMVVFIIPVIFVSSDQSTNNLEIFIHRSFTHYWDGIQTSYIIPTAIFSSRLCIY